MPPFRSILTRSAEVLGLCLLLAYPFDWAVWRVRQGTGQGMGAVPITEITAATLKGNRFEIYDQQTTSHLCSRSLLPQAGSKPCWWLRQHPEVIKQY